MAFNIREALIKAFAAAGKEPPSELQNDVGVNSAKNKKKEIDISYGKSQPRQRDKEKLHLKDKSKNSIPLDRNIKRPSYINTVLPGTPHPSTSSHTHRENKNGEPIQPTLPNQTPPEPYSLELDSASEATCLIYEELDDYLYAPPTNLGIQEQTNNGTYIDEREVVIGLDFGTSSVKVIIGDLALKKAFAVPFSASQGINQYLLPSRLYQTNNEFKLDEGNHAYRDLKLALLANRSDIGTQIHATAFLALVIRHTRGWLLSEHQDTYTKTNIIWKLAIGLPAAHHLQSEDQILFQKIAQAAWIAASTNKNIMTKSNVLRALVRAQRLISGAIPTTPTEEAEINVVPEIAAQIYGYVASNRFDTQARNLYLMVDVGAGTIDSSLFKVSAAKGGRFNFMFYTSQVLPNGVMNLHRYRVDWWKEAIDKTSIGDKIDISALSSSKYFTDKLFSIPEKYNDYFSGINIKYNNSSENPDQHFFMKRVVSQVRGKTVYKTWKDSLLSQQDLSDVPMFLCGGGTRMNFYRNLEHEMKHMPGYSWLKATTRPLEVPRNLVAPGLPSTDYDRLSVAFGLSFLEVKEITKAIPIPMIPATYVPDWTERYIDKDQC